MKRIIFFITHKTLDYEHAELSFKALSLSKDPMIFDTIYIYNTHEYELPNSKIIDLYIKYNLNRFIHNIKLFNYQNTEKTLAADIFQILSYCISNYDLNDRIYLLKSDILVSKNCLNEFKKTDSLNEFFMVPPFVCAKARIDNEKIFAYLDRDKFIKSDDITFFTEDDIQSNNNDFHNRKDGLSIMDKNIEFFATTCKRDFSSHYFTLNLIDKIIFKNQNWGGCNFSNLQSYYIGCENSFVIHKYHSIINNINRFKNREGGVEEWLLS